MLAGVAPRPSRCHHWLIRVAGGNAHAWRARGLDDRPRAEYIRLEPGCGDAVPRAGPHGRVSLRGAGVLATRAVAPVPLTTASRAKAGVVRSYAISNGERLLRSPEPPNPPAVAAVFVLLLRKGAATVARYDVSPTSDAPAVCRARAGLGHSSPAVSLAVAPADGGTRGWLASRGADGDVLVWRTDITAGAREPLAVAARIAGPHTTAALAPAGLVDGGPALLAVDAAFGGLRMYPVQAASGWRARNAIQSCSAPPVVAACLDPRAADRSVSQLVALPLPTEAARCRGRVWQAAAARWRRGRLCARVPCC